MSEPRETTQHSLKSQGAWLLFAKIAGFAFAFVLPLIVVRVLTQEEFGLYRQSFLILMNAVAILPVGITMSAYYYLARDETKRAAAVFNILLVHLVVGAAAFLLLFFFPGILGRIFNSNEMIRLAPLIGVAIWLWLFSVFLEHAAVANREPRRAAAFIIFVQFSKTALLASFVLWFGSVESIIWAAIIQAAIQTLILIAYLQSRFPGFWKSFDPVFLKEHLYYALPFGVAGILWTMQVDLHYYFVSYRYGEAAYAIYAVGCFQLPLVGMLSEAVVSVLIPRMSELQLANDTREMIRVTARAMQKLAFAYFPAYVFLFVTSETFITTLFTNRYSASVPIFQIFLTLLPFTILIADPIVRAYEHLGRFLLRLRIATFAILVAGLYIGIGYLDVRGIIAIVIFIRVAEKILIQLVVCRSIGVKASDAKLLGRVAKTGIISILSGIPTFVLYELIRAPFTRFGRDIAAGYFAAPKDVIVEFITGTVILSVCFALFAALYLTASYFAGTIDESEEQYVRRLFRNPLRGIRG